MSDDVEDGGKSRGRARDYQQKFKWNTARLTATRSFCADETRSTSCPMPLFGAPALILVILAFPCVTSALLLACRGTYLAWIPLFKRSEFVEEGASRRVDGSGSGWSVAIVYFESEGKKASLR